MTIFDRKIHILAIDDDTFAFYDHRIDDRKLWVLAIGQRSFNMNEYACNPRLPVFVFDIRPIVEFN